MYIARNYIIYTWLHQRSQHIRGLFWQNFSTSIGYSLKNVLSSSQLSFRIFTNNFAHTDLLDTDSISSKN